jgi:hypothetical protein
MWGVVGAGGGGDCKKYLAAFVRSDILRHNTVYFGDGYQRFGQARRSIFEVEMIKPPKVVGQKKDCLRC